MSEDRNIVVVNGIEHAFDGEASRSVLRGRLEVVAACDWLRLPKRVLAGGQLTDVVLPAPLRARQAEWSVRYLHFAV